MKIAIVTGDSKGLGASVAKLFLRAGTHVVGISRTENNELVQLANENHVTYEHLKGDLSQENELQKIIEVMGNTLSYHQPAVIYLVNNAASVMPVHQASQIHYEEVSRHINLNMTAPIVLTNALLNQASELDATLIGLTVTSGAAESPIYGWSAYCSTKAGINMYTKTVALEQDELKTNHKIIAFNPGIMDTMMQASIRGHSYEEFKDVERFKSYKKNQLLRDPKEVADILYKVLTDEEKITNGYIYQVNEYL